MYYKLQLNIICILLYIQLIIVLKKYVVLCYKTLNYFILLKVWVFYSKKFTIIAALVANNNNFLARAQVQFPLICVFSGF